MMNTPPALFSASLLILLCFIPAAPGQTLSTWSGGTGDWRDGAAWTPAGVPNDAATDVVVDGAAGTASVVTFGTNTNVGSEFRIGRLRIDAGDTVQFGSATSSLHFWDNAAFPGAGSLTINGLLHLPYESSSLRGVKSITGTGTLRLGSPGGQRPEIYDKTTNAALIQGSALFGRANASNPPMINSGIIEANLPRQDIDFHGQGGANRSINTGTLRAVGGGKMQFGQGEWLNNPPPGTTSISAEGPGSQVAFYRGGLMEGGTVSATNGGVLQVGGLFNSNNGGYSFRNVTQQGPMGLLDQMLLQGTYTNNGTITIPAGRIDALVSGSYDPAQTVTIAGNGQIVLDKALGDSAIGYRRSIWHIRDQVIRGRGQVGDEDFDVPFITNRGTFQADVSGQVLRLKLSGLDNRENGILRAQDGGILRLATGGVLANTGGRIEALRGGRVEANFGRIEGGLVKNEGGEIRLGGMTLVNPGTGLRLEGDLKLGLSDANQEAAIIGEIENKGILRVAASTPHFARLRLGNSPTRSASLTGGGQLILGDPVDGSMESGLMEAFTNSEVFTLTNKDHTIRGFGRIGDPGYDRWLTLVNQGTVTADVPDKTLQIELLSAINTGGTFSASGGGRISIFARNGFNNTGGAVNALAGSKAAFFSTNINGGTITSAATGTLEFPDFNLGRGGVEINNAGNTIFGASGGTREFSGLADGGSTMNNSGTIRKVGTGDYSLRTRMNSLPSGGFDVTTGVLRNFGGGTINANTINVNAGADLTWQGAAPYTFSGVNTFTGGGMPAIAETTTYLADAGTELRTNNFRFYFATLSGPGKLSHTGKLEFYDDSINSISESRVLTLPGGTATIEVRDRSFEFLNGATWENRGTVSFKGFANPRLRGGNGTFFENTATGVLSVDKRNAAFGIMDIPSANKGQIDVIAGGLSFEKPSTWTGGSASIAADQELRVTNTTLTFSGTANTSNGAGFLNLIGNGSLALPASSRLTAERVQFNDTSRASGPGELHVGAEARFFPTGNTAFIDGTQIKLLPGSTSLIQYDGGAWGLQNGAKLRNEGTLNFRRGLNMELKSEGILENAGTMTFTSPGNNPTFGGDGSGLFRTLNGSNARFFPSNGDYYTVSWPFDFAGRVAADSGMTVAFNRGGVFNGSAKLAVPATNSTMLFADQTVPYSVRGQANEVSGEGTVRFENTRVVFEDPTASPTDDPAFSSGTTIALAGGANTSVRVEGNGTMASTRFVFAAPSITIDGSTLETRSGPGSVWISTNGSLSLQNGAKFKNGGTLALTTSAGSWTGATGTLFHNTSTGRLIHDTATTTNIGMPFQNDGVLEFRAGTINFTGLFSGTGGIAASGGAKVTLPLGTAAVDQLPRLLQTNGAGSEINVTLPGGDKFIRVDINGGKLVAAGGGNLIAGAGQSMVAAGGGNMVAAGGMNMVAAGGGNISAIGINTLLATNNLIGNDGSTLVGNDGASLKVDGIVGLNSAAAMALNAAKLDVTGLVGLDSATLTGIAGTSLKGAAGMDLRNNSTASFAGPATNVDIAGTVDLKASEVIARDGAGVKGGALIGNDGSTLIGNDGSTIAGIIGARGKRDIRVPGDPGTIVAATGSLIAGNGTFQGAGYILPTGILRPGKQLLQGANLPGTLTWAGPLEIRSGGTLDVQIGGPAAGTQHDRLNVSQALVINGGLAISFTGGYEASVTPAAVFDIAVSGAALTSSLDGTRAPVANAYGSFLVSIVNDGTTLRLSDYQTVPATFNRWAQRFGLSGADALPEADPNRSGLSNLMKYALGLDAIASGNQGTATGIFTDGQGNRYLTLSYSKPIGAEAPTDLLYEPQRAASPAAGPWSALAADVVSAGPAVSGPGSLETVTVRSTHAIGTGQASDYLRLRVVMLPP